MMNDRYPHGRGDRVLCAVLFCAILGFTGSNAFGQQRVPRGSRPSVESRSNIPSNPEKGIRTDSKSAAASPTNKAAGVATPAAPSTNGRLTFSFRYQPWQEVLDWFAKQSDLSLLMESPPPGTFNYTDTRTYTPAEALDVLNGVLLTKGYTLVRHGKMLVLVNLEDGIPPNLVPDVPLAELDRHGEYELIRVLFPVWNMTPEQAAAEVQPLLGPQGKVVTLPQARQIQVTETSGRLRTIRSIIGSVELPEPNSAGMREFPLKYISFEAAMPTIRQMLGIPPETFSTPDNSVQQLTKSAVSGPDGPDKLLFRGTAQQAARLQEILRLIDVPAAARGINGAPQLNVYAVTSADPEVVVKMLQAMLRDPNVMLTPDKEGGHVFAFATPPQLATIRATIDQMQKESRQVDVINLSNVDPQTAVLAINKLFGNGEDKPDPKAPRVDADITTRNLYVRGTVGQVAQIRELLRKLGETEEEGGPSKTKQHVRLLPLSGAAARSAIAQIEQIWPSVRANRIRVVTPSAGIPSYRPSESQDNSSRSMRTAAPPADGATDPLQQLWLDSLKDRPAPANQPNKPAPADTKSPAVKDRSTQKLLPSRFHLVGDSVEAAAAQNQAPTPPPVAPPTQRQPQPGRGAPIIIAPGSGGTLIASDDIEALDQLEDLLTTVAGHNASSGREYRFYYLKFAKAQVMAEVLAAIFGGSSTGKDKGIIGEMANNALGEVGGGLMSDLLTGGGSSSASFTSAAVDIVPDARLNAILVHAKLNDLDTIEQLLQVLDQKAGPEVVEAEAQPRPIPVYNTTASEMAQMIQQLYQDRMAGPGAVMSPQEMMRMIKGGSNVDQQVQKMSIAVDSRNNMLIVRAPDALFEQVKNMVTYLDQSTGDSPQTTKVYPLQHSNSIALQRALTSLLGNVKTNITPVQGQTGQVQPTQTASGQSSNEEDSPEERMRRAMRRNWDMMQEMRRMQERSGGEGGDRGGFDRSRFFGRGGDRGRGGGDGERGGRGGDGRRE
jgi:type II secretory pathway component GspD/PulD (secretin)